MIDKVQKIREEVEKIKTAHSSVSLKESNPDILVVQVCTNLLFFIDSLQEKPKTDWLQELQEKLDSLSKEDFEKVMAKYSRYGEEEPVSDECIYNRTLEEKQKSCKFCSAACQVRIKEEPVSEDLEEAADSYIKTHGEILCFGKQTFKDGAKWQKKHLWKPVDGDKLPEIDREVIALLDNGKVVFAHRPPEYWDGKDIVTGKVTRNYPKTYDKGGWNIPNVKYWLDCSLPNMED